MSAPQTALQRVNDQPTALDLRLPAPVDKAALRAYLAVIEDPEALELQNRLAKAYDTACRALIGENDVQREGTGDKAREFKKKSAWKKLARYFSIGTTVLAREERFVIDESTGESVFLAICTVRAAAPWGQVADAVAACGTDEETGRRKISIADAIATAETRASNRATSNLIAMGEVSAEETTREEREQVVQRAAEEMTVDEARAVKFPWRQPEKYRDKPLGELSLKMLKVVRDAVAGEIEKTGATPRRLELKFAAELLIAEKEFAAEAEAVAGATTSTAAPDPVVATASEPAAATPAVTEAPAQPAAPIDTTLAPGKLEDAVKANLTPAPTPPTFGQVAARAALLLKDSKLNPDERAEYKKKFDAADNIGAMQALVTELETFLKTPF